MGCLIKFWLLPLRSRHQTSSSTFETSFIVFNIGADSIWLGACCALLIAPTATTLSAPRRTPPMEPARVTMTSMLPVLTDYAVQVDDDTTAGLRQQVAGFLQRRGAAFPGAQPVSFEKKHLQLLCEQE